MKVRKEAIIMGESQQVKAEVEEKMQKLKNNNTTSNNTVTREMLNS